MHKNVLLTQISKNIFKITRYKINLENRPSLFIKDYKDDTKSNMYHALINKEGLIEFTLNNKTILKERKNEDTLSFEINENDGIYGLGIHQFKPFNRRNSNIIMLQYNGRSTAVPFLTSNGGYAILIDSTAYMNIGIDRVCSHEFDEDYDNSNADLNKINLYIDEADEITYYVILGTIEEQIKGYRLLTGKAIMLPKWSYGYFQSKEHYKTQDEILGIAHQFRDRHIPIDCIVQDWNYWGDLGWNALRWDKKNYPNVKAMIDEIHSLDMKLMVSVWPSFGKDTEVAKELMAIDGCITKKDGHVEKWGRIHDPFNPKAADVFWKNMKEYVFDLGGDAWWLDSTEPGADVDKCSHLLESNDCYLGSNARYLNAYALVSGKNVYLHQRADNPNKRVYILTRSGYAGQQEAAISTWTGDITASWACLERQINSLLSFSMSGIPYSTTDIGGFFVNDEDFLGGCNNEEYRELYTRWFWFGVFSPLFRSHGTSTPREPWYYGKPGDKYYDSLIKADNLRYALMPYFYSLAYDIYQNDKTFIKPLIHDYQLDDKILDDYKSYIIGDSLLFSNITEYKKTKTTIYLPKGDNWYNIWTNEKYLGGTNIDIACEISYPPLLVKEGSILLTTEPKECTKYQNNKHLDVRIYTGKDGHCFYYDDHGDNYDFEKNDHLIINFNYNNNAKTLQISNIIGNSAFRVPEELTIYINGKLVKTIKYEGKEMVVDLP